MYKRLYQFLTMVALFGLFVVGTQGIAQSWQPAGTMSTPRAHDQLVVLKNGKVLALAGSSPDNNNPLTSVELYDPASNTWSLAAPLSTGHGLFNGNVVVLLKSGKVMVAGGLGGQWYPTATVEIYDPDLNSWTKAASMLVPRWDHTCTVLSDGRVLVAGGQLGYGCDTTATAELYDPVTDTWRSTGSLTTDLENHQSVLLPDGRVMAVYGNAHCSGTSFQHAETYDPLTEAWTQAGSLLYGHYGSNSLFRLSTGKVLALGHSEGNQGGVAEMYDPAQNQWESSGSRSSERGAASATLLANGKVLVAGGYTSSGQMLSTCELYDPATDTYQPTASMAQARHVPGAALLPDGRVLVAGGATFTGYLNSAELYDPHSYKAEIQAPVKQDGSSVFKATRGSIPIKFTLTDNGLPTCDLPEGNIALTRVSGTSAGAVNESDILMPSDSGSIFRVTDCQYIYNLNSASLGQGTYAVQIKIGNSVVGSATFSLK